jgi:hypothetical protein
MFVKRVGTAHQASGTCQKATARRERQKVATQHAQMKANVEFTVNGKPIEIVEEFEYLGRLVTKEDKEGPAVMRNLARARAKWASMRRFLVRDAADPKTMATFYRTVVLYVLLYGSESWVLTSDLMRQLRSFHRRWCCRGGSTLTQTLCEAFYVVLHRNEQDTRARVGLEFSSECSTTRMTMKAPIRRAVYYERVDTRQSPNQPVAY